MQARKQAPADALFEEGGGAAETLQDLFTPLAS